MNAYEVLQAWLQWLGEFWWVRGIGLIAIFWIFMQILPNNWAGGKLFDRHYAWITSLIATIIVFVVFVLPYVVWQLLLGLLVVALLAALTAWAKKSW